MATTEALPSPAAIERKAAEIDLDPVIRMANAALADKWPPHHVYEVARQYRKFLKLLALTIAEGDRIAPPTRDVHRFWKIHHQDMRLYYPDIITATGRFIHPPLFILWREKDFEATRRLWRKHFGEEPPTDPPRVKRARFLR